MKKYFLKMRLKWETSVLKKNLELKQKIKKLERLLEETRNENHKLIDQKTLDNIRIRELTLESKE